MMAAETDALKDFWKEGLTWDEPLWRYFRADRLAWLFDNSRLYFASPFQFEDAFEGCCALMSPDILVDPRYAEMGWDERPFFELRKNFKINCWHRADFESAAMWKLYADESKGAAICSTPERMRAAIKPYRVAETPAHEVPWAGNVRYQDFLKSPRLQLDLLTRFFFKHQAFAWEQEFRLVVSLHEASDFGVPGLPRDGIEVEVDLDALIERIVLGPSLTEEERESIKDHASRVGLGRRITQSSLCGRPRFI
jgi:hypothetical protein